MFFARARPAPLTGKIKNLSLDSFVKIRKWAKMATFSCRGVLFWTNALPLDGATLQAFDAAHAPCIQPFWSSWKPGADLFFGHLRAKMGQNGHFWLPFFFLAPLLAIGWYLTPGYLAGMAASAIGIPTHPHLGGVFWKWWQAPGVGQSNTLNSIKLNWIPE